MRGLDMVRGVQMNEHILKTVIPVRLDKKTVSQVKKLAKQAGLPFSTMLRMLILEAIKTKETETKT